jgi:hypothetical protein
MAEGEQGTNWRKSHARWVFTGLRSINVVGQDDEVDLGGGFFLLRPNDFLLSARGHHSMNQREFDEAARVPRYLVYKRPLSSSLLEESHDRGEAGAVFQNGLIALQIVKPLPTLGFIFDGIAYGGPTFNLETIEERSPMNPGAWARMRVFDEELLGKVPLTIRKVQQVMDGSSAEGKNAIILLQLGLETNDYHQLIAGLLWVMGMEAIFDSKNRNDFERKLCSCLGPTTQVFPDWNSPTFSPPPYTVKDMAIPVYMLRNKLAHGADLRKAAFDKSTPVDLIKKVKLVDGLEDRANAYLLSEAACYLLYHVLQKTI